VPLISAAISAVAAGIVALLAIFRRAERSILMLLPLLVAALVLLFTIGGMNEGTNPCKEVKGPCVITHGN
jgi:predicted RND superfamily exporter protein